MTRRIPTPFIAPDADPNDPIVGMEVDSGALHEIIVQGSEARLRITKIVRPAEVRVTPQPGVVAWTNQPRITSTPTDTDYWFTTAFGNSIFVMTSAAGNVGYSTDSTTWINSGTITAVMGMGDVMCLHFANGYFVAVGNRFGNAPMAYSTNGTSWTAVSAPFGATDLACVGFNNGVWLALGTNGNAYTASSPNGTWTLAGTSVYPYSPATMMPTKLISFNNQWVGVGDHNRGFAVAANFFVGGTQYVVRSSNGITWTQASPAGATRLVDIATDGSRLVVVDATTNAYKYSSHDAIKWSRSTLTFNRTTNTNVAVESPMTNVAYLNNTWVATTYNGFTLFSPNSFDWITDDYSNNTFVNLPQGTMAVGLNAIVQGGWWKQTVSLVDYGFVRYTVTAPVADPAHPEAPQSFGSVPQYYDPITDMLYVFHQFHKRIGGNAFVVSRIELIKIDPRSKEVVDELLIYERDPLYTSGNTFYPSPNAVYPGNNGELYLDYQDRYGIRRGIFVDPVTMTEIVRITPDGDFAPFYPVAVGGNRYMMWTDNTSSPTITVFERTLDGSFVTTGTFGIALQNGFNSGVRHAPDAANNLLWLVTRSALDDGASSGTAARIAARIDTTTNAVTYINKNPVPLIAGNNSYVTRDPEVINGRLTFNTKRSNNSDQVHGLTVVSQDGLTVTRYGEYDTTYTFGDRNGPIRVTYDGTTGYATDFWDNNALLVWDLTQPSHVRYDQYLYTANTAGVGLINGSGDTGQGTYASPRATLINWTGTYSGVIGIPANGRVVSAPAYNRTAPTVVETITPPAPGTGLITGDHEFVYPGAGALVPVKWHGVVHDGVTRKFITFVQPTDTATNSFYSFLVAGQIDAALYTPNGRIIGRIRRGETEMFVSGYTRSEQPDSLEQYGFVIPPSMPAGTYYVGVLPYYNEQYNGRTVFSDYEFDGYTFDPSTENPGTQPTIKYRVRVQTIPALPAVATIPVVPGTFLDTYSGAGDLSAYTSDSGHTYRIGIPSQTPTFGLLSSYTVQGGYLTNNTGGSNPTTGVVPIGYQITDPSYDYYAEAEFLMPSPPIGGASYRMFVSLLSSTKELAFTVEPDNFFTNTWVTFESFPGGEVYNFQSTSIPVNTVFTVRVELVNNFSEVRMYINGALVGTQTGFTEFDGQVLNLMAGFNTNIAVGTRGRLLRLASGTF